MIERNKFIHEKIMGLCWHEWPNGTKILKSIDSWIECVKCNIKHSVRHPVSENPSYSTNWQEYGNLIEHSKKQEWWKKFTEWLAMWCLGLLDEKSIEEMEYSDDIMLDPDRGSLALARFNGWEGDEK